MKKTGTNDGGDGTSKQPIKDVDAGAYGATSSDTYNRKTGTLAKDRGKTPGALIPNSGLKASESS